MSSVIVDGKRLRAGAPTNNQRIDDGIDDQNKRPQRVLEVARKAGWVQEWNEIVLDEA
jgi:hypothetical protein